MDSRSNEIASYEFLLLNNEYSYAVIVDVSLFLSKDFLLLKNKFLCPLELVRMEIHCTSTIIICSVHHSLDILCDERDEFVRDGTARHSLTSQLYRKQ